MAAVGFGNPQIPPPLCLGIVDAPPTNRCPAPPHPPGSQVVAGVVFNPILNELYHATRGGGAFRNGQPIRASDTASLQSAVFATEVGTSRWVYLAWPVIFNSQFQPILVKHSLASLQTLLLAHTDQTHAVGALLTACLLTRSLLLRPCREAWHVRSRQECICSHGSTHGCPCRPCREDEFLDACFDRICTLTKHMRSVRCCGSCALNLCGVACGRWGGEGRGGEGQGEEQAGWWRGVEQAGRWRGVNLAGQARGGLS